MSASSDRRRAPRIKSEIPVKISSEENDFITQTLNLGASGALFQTERAIPLMSRLAVTLLIPSAGKRKTTKKIVCQGVVVRCDPVSSQTPGRHYNIAIYFTSLKDMDKKSLIQFVEKITKGIP